MKMLLIFLIMISILEAPKCTIRLYSFEFLPQANTVNKEKKALKIKYCGKPPQRKDGHYPRLYYYSILTFISLISPKMVICGKKYTHLLFYPLTIYPLMMMM